MRAEATGWAIAGRLNNLKNFPPQSFIYVGVWHSRKEAVDAHIEALGKDWKYCLKKGDRAIRVKVEEIEK